MARLRLLALPFAVAALAAASLAGCGGGGGGGERLTIYSGRTKNLIDPLLQQYAKESGVAIDVRYGDSGDLALQIDEEGSKSPADVFLSQSPGAMDYLSGKGRLVGLETALLDQVPQAYRSPQDEWVGLSGRVRVLVYNTDQVTADQLPASVFDLVKPEYKDKLAVAPSNGSFQDFVTAIRADIGDDATLDWLRGLKANGATPFANNTAIVQAVGRGEVAMGLVNHYYNEQAKAEDPDVKSANHSFGDGDLGNLVLVTAAGVLDSSGRQEAAQTFLEYLLSEPAQEYFAQQTLEYPLAAGVQPAVDLPELSSIGAPPEDLSALGDLAVTARLIDKSGLAGG